MKQLKSYRIHKLQSEADADKVVRFLLSEQSFDDTRHTPGELEHFRNNPYKSLLGELAYWIATNEDGDVVGVNSVMPNEQKSGGYVWDYIVVHKQYRNFGIASELIEFMFDYLRDQKARFVLTYTCDLDEYASIQRLFRKQGFQMLGRVPDYYFDGEDRLVYYRKLG